MILQFVGVQTITLPLDGTDVVVSVDWGDGTINALLTHTYATAGNYTVQIGFVSGYLTGFGDFGWIGSAQLIGIVQWGNWPELYTISSLGGAALIGVPDSLPSTVINVNSMFRGATIFNQNISTWDVSRVEDMVGMFRNATIFNQDIHSWDASYAAAPWINQISSFRIRSALSDANTPSAIFARGG